MSLCAPDAASQIKIIPRVVVVQLYTGNGTQIAKVSDRAIHLCLFIKVLSFRLRFMIEKYCKRLSTYLKHLLYQFNLTTYKLCNCRFSK